MNKIIVNVFIGMSSKGLHYDISFYAYNTRWSQLVLLHSFLPQALPPFPFPLPQYK